MANKMDPAFAKAMDGDWVVVEKEGDGEEPTSPNPSPFGGQVDQPAFDMLPASSMKSPHHGGGNRRAIAMYWWYHQGSHRNGEFLFCYPCGRVSWFDIDLSHWLAYWVFGLSLFGFRLLVPESFILFWHWQLRQASEESPKVDDQPTSLWQAIAPTCWFMGVNSWHWAISIVWGRLGPFTTNCDLNEVPQDESVNVFVCVMCLFVF